MDGTTLWISLWGSHSFQGFTRNSPRASLRNGGAWHGRAATAGWLLYRPWCTFEREAKQKTRTTRTYGLVWFSRVPQPAVSLLSKRCALSVAILWGTSKSSGRTMVCRSALRCCLLAALTCCLLPGCGGNITVAVMLPDNHHKYPWALPRVFPAILMAHEDLQSKHGLLLGRSINILNYSTEDPVAGSCAESRAQVVAVDAKLYIRPDAFFGPGCVYPLASVGRFASHWKLPLITAGGPAYGFDKREEYQTIVRSGPSTTKLGDFTNALHTHFNWTSRAVVIFHDLRQDDRPHYFLSEGIFLNLKEEMNITVEAQPYEDDYKEYKDLINFMKDRGRSKSRRKIRWFVYFFIYFKGCANKASRSRQTLSSDKSTAGCGKKFYLVKSSGWKPSEVFTSGFSCRREALDLLLPRRFPTLTRGKVLFYDGVVTEECKALGGPWGPDQGHLLVGGGAGPDQTERLVSLCCCPSCSVGVVKRRHFTRPLLRRTMKLIEFKRI